jgi:O-antigen ligase
MLATHLRAIRRQPDRVHALCLAIFLIGGLALLLGGQGGVAHSLGRTSNFSGRTDIWAALISAAPNPIVGAGFESFWISPSTQNFQHTLKLQGWWHPEGLNEAHNGYLEVYLELGWVGLGLISLVLISGYRHAVAAFRLNPSVGSLMLAFIIACAFYNITEAGFRMMDLMWIFLLLGVVASSGTASGIVAKSPRAGAVTRPVNWRPVDWRLHKLT